MREELVRWVEERREREDERVRGARAALVEQLEKRRVGDPITMSLLGVTFAHFLAGVAISVGLSIGTGLLMGALQKRQKITEGDRGGQEFNVTRVAQGTGWPEIFGGDPGDGLGGGIKVAPIILWLSKTPDGYVARKHEQRSSGSGGGKLGGPKQPDVTTITYDLDTLIGWCRGPATLKKLWAATKIIYRADFNTEVNYYQAEDPGNSLAGGASIVSDADASGGHAVLLPLNGSVQFNGVTGDGTPIILEFYLRSTELNSVEMNFVGSPFNDQIGNTGGVYALGEQSLPFVLTVGSSHSIKIKNLSSTPFYVDRLAVRFNSGPIGVPDPTRPTDPTYDPRLPLDPTVPYGEPERRSMGSLLIDHDTRSSAGTISAGNFSGIAIYEGNGTELPDPVVEAQWDGQNGAGSTPAFRQICTTRLANFYLTDYQEAFPPFWGLVEHKTIRNFKDLCEYLCVESGLETGDYDFTDFATIKLRGVVVSPPYTARELMTTLAKIFNCYFYESDKLYGKRMESAPTLALTDADLGWTDDDRDETQVIQLLDAELPPATDIARRVTVRYVSPGRNYEQQSLSEVRQITTSQKEDTLDIQVTATEEEARIFAARELHIDEVESVPYTFTLSPEHLWRHPGTLLTITQNDGTVHYIRLTSIKPTFGVLDCQGIQVDEPLFTQFGTPTGIVFEIPPVPIPASTILGFYDQGTLRTGEVGKSGFYAYGTPRTGPGGWSSAALLKETDGIPETVGHFTRAATVGTTVTTLGPVTDATVEDSLKMITTVSTGFDRFTVANHGFINNETVMFSNSGGALPGGITSIDLYYVKSTAPTTFQVSLTPGGGAVNITTTGTGTNSVQRVIDIDLYGTTATMETITVDQAAAGVRSCLFGDEVITPRTWERVTGFSNRWRGRNLTRAQLSTLYAASLHVTGERFLLLDEAVIFIEQDISALNVLHIYRAVTAGQSYDDAAEIEFTWTGGTLHYSAVTSIKGWKDSDNNWRFACKGQPSLDGSGDRFLFEVLSGPGGSLKRSILGFTRDTFFPAALHSTAGASFSVGAYGQKSYSVDIPGNLVEGDAYTDEFSGGNSGFAQSGPGGDRYLIQATYRTTLDSSVDLINRECSLGTTAHPLLTFKLVVAPEVLGETPYLRVSGATPTDYEDTIGEASGTRYTLEVLRSENKVHFYRNYSGRGSTPFFTLDLSAGGLNIGQAFAAAASLCSWEDIGFICTVPSSDYDAATQGVDFGSTQSSTTVRLSQQRVIQGIVIDGIKTEVTFT